MNKKAKKEVAVKENRVFLKEEQNAYKKYVTNVNKEVSKIDKSYLTIAFNIFNIHANKLYEIDGYKNIYDLSADKFGFSRGTTNNYKKIVETFALLEPSSDTSADEQTSISPVVQLKPEYEKFSSSQLALMLGLTDEQRKKITPDMSTRKIKELIRIWNDASKAIAMADTPTDSADSEEPDEMESDVIEMNQPYSEPDIDVVNSNRVFVCNAKNWTELDSLMEVIHDSLQYVKKSKKDIKPMIEVNIVW